MTETNDLVIAAAMKPGVNVMGLAADHACVLPQLHLAGRKRLLAVAVVSRGELRLEKLVDVAILEIRAVERKVVRDVRRIVTMSRRDIGDGAG